MPGSSDESRSDPTAATATSARLVRWRPSLVWLLAALLVPVLLTAVLLGANAGATETDLRARSLAALEAHGISGVQVEFDGRDATVSAPQGGEVERARSVVASVEGVRTVTVEASGTAQGTSSPAPTKAPGTGPAGEPSGTPTAAPATSDVAPFTLTRTDDKFTVQAVVRDQQAKDKITAEVQALLDEGSDFDNQLTVDQATGLANPSAVAALLHALSTATGEASIKYDGAKVTLTGKVADQATKATAARAAAAAVPGAVVANELRVPTAVKPSISPDCQTFEARLARLMTQHKIVFLSGTAIVNAASRDSVVRAAGVLKSCDSVVVEVGGHTDNLGDPATSLPLSQRRADAVKAALVRLGVPAARITSRGYGESRPVASNSTAAGRIANRRAEIRVP